jgi:sec-independent protein translocase protein TatC
MPFFEHLSELRKRIIIIAVVVSAASLIMYTWAWDVYAFVLKPVMPYLTPTLPGGKLGVLGPFEGFTLRFRVSLYASLVIVSPIIIWQVMAFFLPALKPKERRYVVPTFLAMAALFAAGIIFAYIVVEPVGFKWMLDQTTGSVVGQLGSADKWFMGVTLLLFAFGIGFQLPVIVFYLMIFNVVPYAKLRANWRIAYVVIMVVSAVATPDWSPVTMGALFGALVLLYEASMLLARVVLSKRISEQALEAV